MEIGDDIEIRCANELDFGSYITRTFHIQKVNYFSSSNRIIFFMNLGIGKVGCNTSPICRLA